MSVDEGMARTRWELFYIDPDQPNDGRGAVWRQGGGTLWTPDSLTGGEYIAQTLRSLRVEEPVWAFCHAMPHDVGSWYDLHYPEGVEPALPSAVTPGALGPHAWVPAPEAYLNAGRRREHWRREREGSSS